MSLKRIFGFEQIKYEEKKEPGAGIDIARPAYDVKWVEWVTRSIERMDTNQNWIIRFLWIMFFMLVAHLFGIQVGGV